MLVTHFLIELTLFTTRLNRTYTFFLFGFLNRLLFNIQRLRFLLRLTFIIVTAAATFTTRRLLLVGGTCFFPLPQLADGSHASRQSAAVPGDDYDGFLRDYHRCLQYVHYGCRGAHYGHGGCSDEACDDPVDVPVSLLLSVLVAR
ncbi:hypothetical protein ACLB1T_24890 [Escherichia coli]